MTYAETIAHHGEAAVTCTISDVDALSVLRRGLRYGATVTAGKDGTVTIIRTRLVLDGDDVVERKTMVVLNPGAKPARLTKTQYSDLKRIEAAVGRARLLPEGRITARLYRIPPTAAKRLLDRGLVVATTREGRVEIGVAGLLAMTAYEHPARTTAPRGWHYPEGACINTTRNHRAHPYQVLDRVSIAICLCGLYAAHDGRQYAAAAVRKHLGEQLAAALSTAGRMSERSAA